MNPTTILLLPPGCGQVVRQWRNSLISNLGGPKVFAIVCCIPLAVFAVVCIAKFVFWLIHRHKSRRDTDPDSADEAVTLAARKIENRGAKSHNLVTIVIHQGDKKHDKRKKRRKHLREDAHDRTE